MTDTVKRATDAQIEVMDERLETYQDKFKAAQKELLDYNTKVGNLFKITRNNELITRVGNAEKDLNDFKRSYNYLSNLDENLDYIPQPQQ